LAAIEVHRTLGPGLLESIYMLCLQFELKARNLKFVAQRRIPIGNKQARAEPVGYLAHLIGLSDRRSRRRSRP